MIFEPTAGRKATFADASVTDLGKKHTACMILHNRISSVQAQTNVHMVKFRTFAVTMCLIMTVPTSFGIDLNVYDRLFAAMV